MRIIQCISVVWFILFLFVVVDFIEREIRWNRYIDSLQIIEPLSSLTLSGAVLHANE